MAKYKRIKGGEKNDLSGTPFTRIELEKIYDLYIEIDGKGIHENNPKIHKLAEQLNRTIRSIENQLLGFRIVDTGTSGRANYNKLIKQIWQERISQVDNKKAEILSNRAERKKKRLAENDFKFRISSQLKNIIGKELITDDYIAIFELVKNSFDAHAKKVKVIFEEDKIIIWDDGKGMNKEDIIDKWLFVAYSAKKEGVEDAEFELGKNKSYRNKISPKKNFAGAKGIGRFSADRLGETLHLTTKKITNDSLFWTLDFNWDDFEEDAEEEFVNIDVNHNSFDTSPIIDFKNGVVLEISNLRSIWSRQKILNLKWSLEKLINPFAEVDKKDGSETFDIEIICPEEIQKDNELKKQENFNYRDIVNGSVKNFVFETLDIKTTRISIETKEIFKNGEKKSLLITKLLDRGNLIYEIEELNPYNYIPIGSRMQLFYLNLAAKINFTKLMGVRAKDFGSIFLFNNGFRVFPIGEPDNDPFGIDKRKAQGYSRFLGTRELIGSVEIWGLSEHFVEASSRDGGLIDSVGTRQLENFIEYCLKRLEKYVQPILWQIKKRTGSEEEEIDLDAKTEIIELIAKLAGNKDIKLINYSKSFLNILDDKTELSNSEVFNNLKKIAEETKDNKFINEIDKSQLEFIKLRQEKEEEERKRIEAEEIADEEKRKRELAEQKLKQEEEKRKEEEYRRLKAEEEARKERAKRVAEEQRRRQKESQVKFLESISSLDIEDVLNLHHQIGIDSNTIDTHISNMKRKIDRGASIKDDEITNFLDKVTFANKKILAVTKFSTKQNFMAAARVTEDDIISFFKNYLLNIYKYHLGKDLDLKVNDEIEKSFIVKFKPIEMTIIIDNLISNSKKKNAKKVSFTFRLGKDNNLEIVYKDDGDGLDKNIIEPKTIFERGITTTRGSGLGLHHVKKIITEQNGSIEINTNVEKGIEFIINMKK